MKDIKGVLAYSMGKDSTATALYLMAQGIPFRAVYCDTGWEHPLTEWYKSYINETLFSGELITIRSEVYPNGMRDLIRKKGRVPSAKSSFCTEQLKVLVMKEWLQTQEVDVVYQGIRAAESTKRKEMPEQEWSDVYDAEVVRPIFNWSAKEVFAIHKLYDVEPNPLYKKGASRVGCFPCVMVNHGELSRMQRSFPEVWERAIELEKICGRSFFPPNYIPTRYHTGFDPVSEKTFPWVIDVRRYLSEPRSYPETEDNSCFSIYNLCE